METPLRTATDQLKNPNPVKIEYKNKTTSYSISLELYHGKQSIMATTISPGQRFCGSIPREYTQNLIEKSTFNKIEKEPEIFDKSTYGNRIQRLISKHRKLNIEGDISFTIPENLVF
jgi:hypothetical protein